MAVKRSIPTSTIEHSASDVSAGAAPFEASESAKSAAPQSKVGAVASGADAAPNVELIELFVGYDDKVEKAEASFIELCEFIQKNQVPRATVVVSLMRARNITYESAQKQYTSMKKLLNDEVVLQELKDGKITMKVAKEKVSPTKSTPKAANPKNKEAAFTETLKRFIGAAKESGFAWIEILASIEAERRSAGIK